MAGAAYQASFFQFARQTCLSLPGILLCFSFFFPMSFDLKTTVQPDAELSPQQKKLNRLIEKIEQQKIDLTAWEKAQNDIQQYARQTLVPVYNELHTVLFQQLEQLWKHLHGGKFSKAEVMLLDEKNPTPCSLFKRLKSLVRARNQYSRRN